MSEFIQAVGEHAFLQRAVLAGLIASVACGVIGSYVVARRITYLAGGIAHCVLGGMGVAYYLNKECGVAWLHPLHGAIVAAIVAALIIGYVTLRTRQREDTVISALWAIGMAVGILFIARTQGYAENLMSYLFGNIMLVSPDELWLMGALDLLVVGLGVLFYNKFLAVCFDEEFARLRGVNVEFYYLLLLCLAALTVVVLVTVVGLVMVIALITLPVAVAGLLASRLWCIMVLAAIVSMIVTTGGLALSYGPELQPGATTILLAGALYLLALAACRVRRTLARSG